MLQAKTVATTVLCMAAIFKHAKLHLCVKIEPECSKVREESGRLRRLPRKAILQTKLCVLEGQGTSWKAVCSRLP